jgi:hypothetical protein
MSKCVSPRGAYELLGPIIKFQRNFWAIITEKVGNAKNRKGQGVYSHYSKKLDISTQYKLGFWFEFSIFRIFSKSIAK